MFREKNHDCSCTVRRHNTMRALPVILLVVVVVVAVFANGVDAGSLRRTDPACKTVETVADLDLSAYTVHPWYVQQQQVSFSNSEL